MSGVPEPRRPLLRAALHPFTSARLWQHLEADRVLVRMLEVYERQGRSDLAQILRVDLAQLREAHRQFTEWAAREGVSDGGNAEVVSAEAGAESVVMEITTDQAAGLLGRTPQRVTQLIRCGDLRARRVGRSWLVERESVTDLLEARRSA